MLANLRDVFSELVMQPLLWLLTKGTRMDDMDLPVDMAARGYAPLGGPGLDRLALLDLHPDDPGPVAPDDLDDGWTPDGWDRLDEPDPGATDGVDPASGLPLEQTGVNVRLAP